ncbi:MAG: carboxypeptidase-like regulatory domain-containing protein [Candidatus Aenigmatarchaeota archaeon]
MSKPLLAAVILVLLVFASGCISQRGPNLNFSVTDSAGSKQKEVTLSVTDPGGMPLKNASVYYEQVGQDFMYNAGEYWDSGARELGTNTQGIYLDWEWGKLEPQDGVYDWSRLEATGIVDGSGGLVPGQAEHTFLRLGVISTSAWIVGEKMDAFQETGYPEWIDKNNLTQVREEYLEFVPALIGHLKFRPDFYMVEVEINALGINAGMTNQEIIGWLGQLTDKIKEADPGAKVSIVVTSSDLSPFMDEGRAKNIFLLEQDRYPLRVTDFLKKMEGVDYDMVSVFIQPFGWFSRGDSADAEKFIDSLCAFNKTVYIASASFLAKEPDVPEELDPRPNGANATGFVYYPNPQASDEWQKEQTQELMDYAISSPCVAGIHWDMYDFVETGVGGKDVQVKLATGFTSGYRDANGEIVEGKKRLVYGSMKELWQGLFSEGTLPTGDDGKAAFIGLSGRYRIVVSHPGFGTKETTIDV